MAPAPHGKYGRRPPKNAPALRLGRLLTGTVPPHPAAEDYIAELGGGWQMLGNDEAGDCVAVTWASERRLVTSLLTGTPTYPGQDQVWAFYQTQNPGFHPDGGQADGPGSGQDNGMDIQTALETLHTEGGPDGVKAVAFAKVDVLDLDEVRAALAIFGSLWIGCTVTQANEQEFGQGRPWNYVPGSPTAGGHSVMGAGYGAPGRGALAGDARIQTWAAETSFTDIMWARQVQEAWAVIWPEHLGTRAFVDGVDIDMLEADYLELTGDPLVIPTPSQTAARVLWAAAGPWCQERRTRPDLVTLKAALETFAASEGLG